MREILFRGKRVDNGEWVEGDLTQDRDTRYSCICGYEYYNDSEGPQREPFCYLVNPSTVGQFTGLTDKNGKKIFEGDIVRAQGIKKWSYRVETGIFHPQGLSYQHGIFRTQVDTLCGVYGVELSTGQECFIGFNPDESGNIEQLEVIGNIYDEATLEKREGKENDG